MAKTWAEITADAEFAALPAADQEQVREAFWQRRVQPSLGEGADIEQARAYFDKATRIRKVDMAPDIVPSTAGAGRGLAAAPVIPTRKGGLRRESVPFVGGTAREGLAAAETPPQQDTMPYDVVPVVGPADEGGVGKGVRGVLSDIKANTAARNARMGSPLDLPRDPATVNGSRDAPPPVEGPGVMSRENDVFAPAVGQLSERQKAVLQSRNPQIAKERAAQERSWGEMRPVDSQQKLAWAVEDAVAGKNPVLRGAVAGVAGLGKIGVGAVRLAADLAGADDVAAFAAGAAGAASATERGATQGLQGNEKLVADVTNSIINSAPSVALGMAGGPALRTLFATSTLQEYNAGRDAGFGVPESLSRAGIMGTAEALGERFGFPQQIALLKGAVKGMPKGEVARVFGDMLAKEIPGEQLTTAIQFLADKIGPAALRPNATLADYLEAAGDTLAVTVAQTGVMGGGPAAISTVRNTYQAADRAAQAPESAIAGAINQTADAFSRFYQPAPEATAPTAARADSLKRFDEAAAAWGLSPKAAEAVRAQAGAMPAGDVPGFLARVSAAFAKRGLYKKAPDDASVAELDKRLRPPPADPTAAAQPTPAPMPPAPAAQETPDVAQPDVAVPAGQPAGPGAAAAPDAVGSGVAAGRVAADAGGLQPDVAAGTAPGSGTDAPAVAAGQPNTPLTSKFTPEQAMARMERQAAADGQRRAEAVEFEDREASDILSPKGTAWAAKVGASKRLRELGDGYRLARVSTGWVIKPQEATAKAAESAPRPEWAAFPAESGSKGIPRADMPQIKAEHRGAMVQFLKGRGILHEQEQDVDPATLKATQGEYSPEKVDRARAFKEGDRAILVSSDNHILDGHHQWVAALADKKPIRVIRLDAPIDKLLPVVREFPSAESAAGSTPAASSEQTAAPKQVMVGKLPDGTGFGSSVGGYSTGDRRQLMVDPDGGYFWGEWSESWARDGSKPIVGKHAGFTPAKFASGKEAREAAAATPQTKSEPTDPNAAAPVSTQAPPEGRATAAAAPAAPREPFEHAGLKVYPGRVRVGDTVEDRWAVQLPENKSTGKVLGDTLHKTREDAMKAAEQEVARYEREQRNAAELKSAEDARKADDEARKEANRGKSIAERQVDATLDKQTRENGEVMTRREWVQRKVSEGLQPRIEQEDRIKPMTRTQFNRASNEEQRAHERKIKEAGKKDVYWIGDYEVTKTEHDYAVSLKAARATPTAFPTGSRVTLDGTAYTVTKVGKSSVTLTDEAGTLRPVQKASPTWAKIKPSSESPAPKASTSAAAPAATESPAPNAAAPAAGQPAVADGEKAPVTRSAGPEAAAPSAPRAFKIKDAASIEAKKTPGATVEKTAAGWIVKPPEAATHQDPGEAPEPATKAVVAEAIKTAADKRDIPRSQMKAEALRLIDEAIAKAPSARDNPRAVHPDNLDANEKSRQYTALIKAGKAKTYADAHELLLKEYVKATPRITIDVPGDGKFTVINTKEKLREFRKQVEANPGFRDKLPTFPIGKATTSANLGPDGLAREMLDEGEPVNALEVLEAAGKTMYFGAGGQESVVPYTHAEPLDLGDLQAFVGRPWRDKKGKNGAWSVTEIRSGLRLGGGDTKAEAIADARKTIERAESKAKIEQVMASGKALDGTPFRSQSELREQFIKDAQAKQQSTFDEEDRRQARVAAEQAREKARDAAYQAIMGTDARRPVRSGNGWTPEEIKAFLDQAEKAGKVDDALALLDELGLTDSERSMTAVPIQNWRKGYELRRPRFDTGWKTSTGPGGMLRITREVKAKDGTTYTATLDEFAGAYVTGTITQKVDGTARKVKSWSNDMDARAQADRFMDSAAEGVKEKPAAPAPAPVSSREGQMDLAYRGSRIATLKAMNEQLRKLAPGEAWSDKGIEESDDLDGLQDAISKALVEAQNGKPAANPLRAELEAMSGAELRAVMDRMGLAGARMVQEERIAALLAEDPAEVRKAINQPSEKPVTTSPPVLAAGFSAMRGHVEDGRRVLVSGDRILTVKSSMNGWELRDDAGALVSGPHKSAQALESAVVALDGEAAAPSAEEKAAPPATIQDVGEKIGGARKDMAVSTAQGAIDAFNADDSAQAMQIVAKLKIDALQEVGAAIGYRPQINETAKAFRERLGGVANKLTKTAREKSARQKALYDKLIDRAMAYDRAADHMANSLRLGNAVDSEANTTSYKPMDGDESQWLPIPQALAKYAADVDSLRNDPEFAEVAPMVSGKRPRVFEHKAASSPAPEKTTPAAEGGSSPAAPSAEEKAAPPKATVENFGETLPPARRVMAAKLDESLSDEDIARRPLSEIWPLAENEAIEDTFAAAVAHAARAAIPAKPRQPYKLKRWVESVKTMRGLAGHVVAGRLTPERLAEEVAGRFASLKDWRSKVVLLEQLPREQWKRIGVVEERPDAFSYTEDSKRVPSPMLRITVDDKSHWLSGDGTVSGSLDQVRALLGEAAPEQRMQFEVRGSGPYKVNKKGDPEYRALMTFGSAKEAFDAIREGYDGLVAAWEQVKARDNVTERDVRSAENRPRAGKDYRGGKDVTPEQFQEQFGFRGGEWGKWVKQGKGDKERQALLNSAYDALMDLADIVGIPPRAISLNGTLGIAFGSRGSGWASAHFEPSNLVINLTKTRGAGALAHEWLHALDNYFARMRRGGAEATFNGDQTKYRNENYITHRPEPLMVRKDRSRHFPPMTVGQLEAKHEARQKKGGMGWPEIDAYAPEKWERDPATPEGVRPEVEARFAALVQVLKDSPMAKRAALLDKGGGYWSRTLEVAARAFESFVQARMMEQGYHNDFLANVVPVENFARDPGRYPYLLAGEVKPIAEAFDGLFGALETRTDDAGNVVLFSRTMGDPSPARKAFSRLDDLFALPSTDATDVTEIARAIDPGIKVTPHLAEGLDRYDITMPGGATASIYVREPSPWGPHTYGNTYDEDNNLIATTTERPGANRNRVPEGTGDVWVNVSKFKRGDGGAKVYAIAGALAHNTGRIFIGDPNGVSDDAMQRRPEQMLSLALRYGTTDFLAPHPQQLLGSAKNGIPPLKWSYGDDAANIRALIDLNLRALENQGYGDDSLRFDLDTGTYRDGSGQELSRADIAALAASGFGRGALAGGNSLARAAVLRALLREGRREGEAGGGRDGLLAAIAKLRDDSPQAVAGLFKRADEAQPAEQGRQVEVARVTATAKAVREAWAVKPDLVVFFGLQDPKLPPSVRDYDNQQRSQGAVGDIEGFYWQGRIYVNAAALQTDADVVRVMYHEGLGHAGLRGHFGSELDRVLDQMARLYDQRALQKKAVAYGEANTDKDGNFVSYKTEKSAALAAEELLAELAQTRPTSMWVRRAIAAIRTWLRENLPGLFGKMALSDAEVIERFIVPARGFIERGRAAQQRDAVPAFSRGDESDKDLIAQLQEFGRMAVSRMDAERAFNDGDRLFVVHDQSDEDTLPTEVNSVRQLDPYAPDQIMILPAERAMFGRTDQTQRKGTEDDAIAAGFTLKAYRGISKARPFNDTGTTWLTTSREVAEAYAEEVMGYDDPGVLTVMVKPDNLPRHDASRLTDEQREELQADGFGNPQAVGIYDRSDDHPLGGSRRNVTVIHAPREAVFVIDDDGSRLSRAASVTDTPAFRAWFGDSKVVDEQGKPLVVYHGTRESFDAFDTAKQSDRAWYGKGFYFASDPKAAGGLGTADARGELPTFQELEWAASFNGAGFAWQNQRWQLSRPLTGADARKVVQRLGTKVALRDAREDIGTADRWRSVMRAAQEGPEALTRELATNGNAWGVLDKIGVARDIASAPNVMPLYLSIQNPAIWPAKPGPEHDGIHDPVKGYWIAFRPEQIKSATGNRGTFDPTSADIRFSRTAEKTTKAERKKLAQALTNGTNAMRGVRLPAQYVLGDLVGKSVGRLHWWHRTVGTPFNLALMQPQFKPVYDSLQDFIGDISHYASEAQKLAPRLLPRMDGIRDVFKGPISAADAKAVAAPVFEGTLGWIRTAQGDPIKVEDAEAQAASMSADEKAQEMLRSNLLSARVLKMWQGLPVDQYEAAIETRYASQVLRPGVVWSDAELRSMFKLTDSQIDLYKEFRTATDKSLDDLTISAMLRVAGDDAADIRARVLEESDLNAAAEMIRDRLFEMAESDPANADRWNEKGNDVIDMADRVEDLKARGYAPLMRFGSLTLDVVTPDGQRQYFGLFENDRERKRKVREMRANFPDAEITQGTVSQREFELFAGVTPETLELFADKLGIPKEVQEGEIYQKWLQFAKSNRSGLKRLIHRKGVPGFSEEVGRVLAAFIYSNARQTSGNLHAGAAEKAMADIDQRDGELKDYAKGLIDSVRNPTEQAQALKAMMFTQFLGGSFASALVNMTQPFTVTGPYLAQYGGEAKAAKQMAAALKDVGRRVFPNDPGLAKALRLAEEDGTVMPQEIFSLQAQASGRAQLSSGDGTVLGTAGKLANNGLARLSLLWGRPFAWAEMFNRRLTYIAAYRTAVDQGMPDPAAFAKDAVNTTQIVYNAGNRPKWARSYAGAVLMTFKQFATSMIELLARSMRTPQGRRTALAMLLMLVVVSGLEGLPFREDIEDLIDGFMQRVLDQNFSTKEWRNRKLVEGLLAGLREFGVTDPKWAQGIADGLNNGLTGIPGMPFDVSGRLGLHNLIPGTGLLLKKESYGRDVAELAGPAGSFGARLFEAGGQALSGSPGKALLTASPLGVQNAAKGLEMAKTGRYPDTKDNMVVRTTLGDAISKGAGFQPQRVKVAQDVTFQQKRFTALAQQVEGEIVDTIAKGLVKEDEAQQKEGWDRLAAWNEKNPKTPIKITAQQIRTRVQNMTTEKTVRMMKTTPRELRPGLADAFRKLEPAGADE